MKRRENEILLKIANKTEIVKITLRDNFIFEKYPFYSTLLWNLLTRMCILMCVTAEAEAHSTFVNAKYL